MPCEILIFTQTVWEILGKLLDLLKRNQIFSTFHLEHLVNHLVF